MADCLLHLSNLQLSAQIVLVQDQKTTGKSFAQAISPASAAFTSDVTIQLRNFKCRPAAWSVRPEQTRNTGSMQQAVTFQRVCPVGHSSQQLGAPQSWSSCLPQQPRRQPLRMHCLRTAPSAQVLPGKTPEWSPPSEPGTEPGRVPPDYSPPGEKPGKPSAPPEFSPPEQAPASPTVPESDPPMRPLPPDEEPKMPEVPVPERDPYKPLPGRETERRTEESPAVEPSVEPARLKQS
ncbi:hypothetical protein WJX84_004952 [Apatococcus fuscideae]|uniref:Uncharacterized protein n=1 Tax=Apatococcus fuscideae TaxID=2026836 RepID=A0AAW1TFH4_9CHLO